MKSQRPIKVAIIGTGCASVTTAFELTRPEHKGKYEVTLYQMGWRMGGKGASGRGPSGRIEEHGLHIWMGDYENAFRLLRECYAELAKENPHRKFANWQDAFVQESHIGIADPSSQSGWLVWSSLFPPVPGLPGDPLTAHNPFSLTSYLLQASSLLRALLLGLYTWKTADDGSEINELSSRYSLDYETEPSPESVTESIKRLLQLGLLSSFAGVIEALNLVKLVLQSLPSYPQNLILRFMEKLNDSIRFHLEDYILQDDELRLKWQIIDMIWAIIIGVFRFNLLLDTRGLDAINDYDFQEWLLLNGASEETVNSAFIRGLYGLVFAFEDGDIAKPGIAAGQNLRGFLRMFFTYRGSLFWKMRGGMGDVIFAPYYEALIKRGAKVKFFHRLQKVNLVAPTNLAQGEKPYVESLEFDIQAKVKEGKEYEPLFNLNGLLCWPSSPDFTQLEGGEGLAKKGVDFESHWDTTKVDTLTLNVTKDFDFVVYGASIATIPHTCSDILQRDARWRDMVRHVKTVPTQALQLWLKQDMRTLGWNAPPIVMTGFVSPFDTWADMEHLIEEENWQENPKAIAYFCNVLADPPVPPDRSDVDYPKRRLEEVRQNAIEFLNQDIEHLWPKAVNAEGFRWDLLADANGVQAKKKPAVGSDRLSTQYLRANVNPTDRYVLSLPGSLKYRISPLDNAYDNLTIAGDWTECGFNYGCVEAAVISGRLAAHAISQYPPLEDIIGYDHP